MQDDACRSGADVEPLVRRLIKQQSPEALRGAVLRMMERPDSMAVIEALKRARLIRRRRRRRADPVDESRKMFAAHPKAELVVMPRDRSSREPRTARAFNDVLRPFSVGYSCHALIVTRRVAESWAALSSRRKRGRRQVTSLVAALFLIGASAFPLPAQDKPPSTVSPLHQPFDEILDLYVRDGFVYYNALAAATAPASIVISRR